MAQGRIRRPAAEGSLVARIDAVLPQSQCTKCGYPGCEPYARAVASGAAGINQCPPGGDRVIGRLATLLGRDRVPLDPARGVERPRHVARIDEQRCIGCTLCIQACPVDAIVGAARQMHTVVVELCTGCDLCVAPCPVDCITMTPATGRDAEWTRPRMDAARERFDRRERRLARDASQRVAARMHRSQPAAPLTAERKRAEIRAAVARVRARRGAADRSSS
jgi:H+/Na+-translocating ferredoxin:NAD+ oxidoreductase subunit B